MSVSQALMAFPSPEVRPSGSPGLDKGPLKSGAAGKEDAFSKILADQQPDEVAEFFDTLEQNGLAAIDDIALAGDGKPLPDSIKDWLGQLSTIGQEEGVADAMLAVDSDPQAIAAVSERWMQWLQEARVSLGGDEGSELESVQSGVPGAITDLLNPASEPVATAFTLRSFAAGSADGAAAEGRGGKGELALEEAGKDQSNRRHVSGNEQMQSAAPVQRSASVALALEMQPAFAAKLAEQLDQKGLRGSTAEAEAVDLMSRPGSSAESSAQSALTARPVTGASQALGVPFGQQSWGEAMVQKVMWMSSQNLRSVEIRLDPAELGPLEIHIQNRGQEHHVQFVSQNPSVREALESQMYRLREMFSQQGMDQLDVSVADSSVGQQTGRDAQEELAGRSRRADEQAGLGASEDSAQSLITTSAAAMVSSDRLVDFFA